MDRPSLTFLLGGARSGKSRLAERLALDTGLAPVYIATATAGDDEMAERIAQHRADRGTAWLTVEVPLDLPGAVLAESRADRVLLVDCLTLWVTNLLLADRPVPVAELLVALAARQGPVVLVGNETGMGIVPMGELSRRFRDESGRLHQEVAAAADEVALVVAGLPLWLKRHGRPVG
jgi:adenosylcobinamide kinase/adenosylcobinamide-phosphate guanylyltransferase